jgi:hypothetical protein
MATATAMYHSGRNPLRRVTREGAGVPVPKGLRVRRLHKAFLRYHDANNWPLLREALRRMGRADLIGPGREQLLPAWQPRGTGEAAEGQRRAHAPRAARAAGAQPMRTQHTGLPRTPRAPGLAVGKPANKPVGKPTGKPSGKPHGKVGGRAQPRGRR